MSLSYKKVLESRTSSTVKFAPYKCHGSLLDEIADILPLAIGCLLARMYAIGESKVNTYIRVSLFFFVATICTNYSTYLPVRSKDCDQWSVKAIREFDELTSQDEMLTALYSTYSTVSEADSLEMLLLVAGDKNQITFKESGGSQLKNSSDTLKNVWKIPSI